MYRCTPTFRLAFFVYLCLGVVSVDSFANPGTTAEPYGMQRGVMDPVVERVRSAIVKEVPGARYDVRIYNFSDYVLLEGEVDSQSARERIVQAAHTASAKNVRDEMRIRPALPDDRIAEAVRSALQAEYPRLASRITVQVSNGIAYLAGDVSNHREVDELLSTTLMVEGVKDVRSDITLHGRPYTHRH